MSKKLLKSSKKINFGCGTNVLDGFINVDLIARKNVYPHNVTNSFPLEDNSIEAIYTEHMIEHLTLQEVLFFLRLGWLCSLFGQKPTDPTEGLQRLFFV